MRFTVNATETPEFEFYDYIVVGGGTAGCPLAATLSKTYKVLLLERGGVPYGNQNLMTEEGFHSILAGELSNNDDPSDSPAQRFTSIEGVSNARGRVLGGSSAIGAGFYSRADHEFYGLSGIKWDFGLVKESYKWIENAIVFEPKLKNWQSAVFNGFIQAKIGPKIGYSLNHELGTKIGGSTFDHGGRRYSAADLLSYYANPSNIKVIIHAIVESVTFKCVAGSPGKVTGVVYSDEQGTKHYALLRNRGEVFLSAGALGSPQILRFSGIGDRDLLRKGKIPMIRHNPFVGHFLHDSPRNGISIIVPSMPIEQSLMKVVGVTNLGEYLETASYIVEFNAGNKTSSFVKSFNYPVNFTAATLMVKVARPYSSGFLFQSFTDFKMSPAVSFGYFHHPDDLEKCVKGIRKIHDVLRTQSMKEFQYPQCCDGVKDFRYIGPPLPADLSDHAAVQQYCQQTKSTSWDYHGGCVVGKVVDENFKVMGVDGLRVVDGSIFTVSPGTSPQATVMMLGR